MQVQLCLLQKIAFSITWLLNWLQSRTINGNRNDFHFGKEQRPHVTFRRDAGKTAIVAKLVWRYITKSGDLGEQSVHALHNQQSRISPWNRSKRRSRASQMPMALSSMQSMHWDLSGARRRHTACPRWVDYLANVCDLRRCKFANLKYTEQICVVLDIALDAHSESPR